MIRKLKTTGGPIKSQNSYEDMKRFHGLFRSLLIDEGFGLCSRGPITYDCMKVIFGSKRTEQYWKQAWKESEHV